MAVMSMMTAVGDFPIPPDIEARWRAAPKRKSGRLDLRTREGKALSTWEREFCDRKVREYLRGWWHGR